MFASALISHCFDPSRKSCMQNGHSPKTWLVYLKNILPNYFAISILRLPRSRLPLEFTFRIPCWNQNHSIEWVNGWKTSFTSKCTHMGSIIRAYARDQKQENRTGIYNRSYTLRSHSFDLLSVEISRAWHALRLVGNINSRDNAMRSVKHLHCHYNLMIGSGI